MLEERRQFPRLVPSTPLFVSMDDAKGGLLLDLCEGGLAVASLVPRNLDDVVSLTFDLPEGVGHIEAKAQVAWTRDSGHLTGVRFMDLDDVSQQQLSEWIAAGTNLRPAGGEELDEPIIVTRSTYAQVDAIRQQVRFETRNLMFPEKQIEAQPVVEMRPVEAEEPEPVAASEVATPVISAETMAELERIETTEEPAATPMETTRTLFPDLMAGAPTAEPEDESCVGLEMASAETAEVEEVKIEEPSEIEAAGAAMEMEEASEIPEMGMREVGAESESEAEVTARSEAVATPEFAATTEPAMTVELETTVEAAEAEAAEAEANSAGSTNRAEWVEHVAQMEDIAPVEIRVETGSQTLPPDAETVGWASDAVGWVQEIAEKRITAPEEVEFDGVFVSDEAKAAKASRSIKSRHTIELVLAVVLLTWALVFLGYQMGSTGANQATRDISLPKAVGGASASASAGGKAEPGKAGASVIAPTTSAEAFPEMSPVPPITRTGKVSIPDLKTNAAALETPAAHSVSTAAAPKAPARAPRETVSASAGETQVLAGATPTVNSGVVLQVGAMKMEGNATALMQDLKKKKFSAFVYRHGNDSLYRVGVGPFGDKDASARVKSELQKNGYSAITAKWTKDKG